MTDADKARFREAIREADKACKFAVNTCPSSRHAQMMAEHMLKGLPYPMLEEEREYCGESIMWTVISLYKARDRIAELEAALSEVAK